MKYFYCKRYGILGEMCDDGELFRCINGEWFGKIEGDTIIIGETNDHYKHDIIWRGPELPFDHYNTNINWIIENT